MLAICLEEKEANNRISQYETNYRTSKKTFKQNHLCTSCKFIKLLYGNLQKYRRYYANFFLIRYEVNLNIVNLFQMTKNSELSTEVQYKYSSNLLTI